MKKYELKKTKDLEKIFVIILKVCYNSVNHEVTKFHFEVVDFIDNKMI
ncbi:MAG: hypothetical protein IJB21_02660 [Bacilli bacterium]|nr:hypothetical protein [Bacilli bacterium]